MRIFTMVGEAMGTDWCIYDQWAQNMRGDENRWRLRRWEPIIVCMAGGSIYVKSPPIASEIMGISTSKRRVVIPFT
jgi:hypothetical protein